VARASPTAQQQLRPRRSKPQRALGFIERLGRGSRRRDSVYVDRCPCPIRDVGRAFVSTSHRVEAMSPQEPCSARLPLEGRFNSSPPSPPRRRRRGQRFGRQLRAVSARFLSGRSPTRSRPDGASTDQRGDWRKMGPAATSLGHRDLTHWRARVDWTRATTALRDQRHGWSEQQRHPGSAVVAFKETTPGGVWQKGRGATAQG